MTASLADGALVTALHLREPGVRDLLAQSGAHVRRVRGAGAGCP
ncbi:hypothetical protein [Streptomyces viridosporus]|nr:hypothetical protein [Streptomyces viridosporus]